MNPVRFLSRLPIRARLTLASTVAMAAVLTGVGVLVYTGMGLAMDRSISADLTSRADLVRSFLLQTESALQAGGAGRIAEEPTGFVQVLSVAGAVIDSTPEVARQPVLTAAQLARAASGTVTFDRMVASGLDGQLRLLATPIRAQDMDLVVVVGSSLEGRAEALAQLLIELLIAGPIALILAAGLAFLITSRALRPVEAMRQEADAISAIEPGRRLPVPVANDEIARLSTTLNEMLARLESSLARERSFISDASHELRTPLALLKAEVDLALDRPRKVDELQEALRSVAGETDRLSQLADDLLLLARIDDGHLPMRRTPAKVDEMLGSVRERFLRRATEAGRRIKIDAPPDLVVMGDRLQLEQVLANLMENTLRYGAGEVVVSARDTDEGVELHVIDHGRGFPEELLSRAFERFSRSKGSRAQAGAGLGLAIVAVIAQAHGGSAHAANRATGGADVWVLLPRRPGGG